MPRFYRRPLAVEAERQEDGTWVVIRDGQPQEVLTDSDFRREYKAGDTAAERELQKEIKPKKTHAKRKTKKVSEEVTSSDNSETETYGGEVTEDAPNTEPTEEDTQD